jgi:hypothetical protein
VSDWKDEDKLAKQLADECYESAKRCAQEGKSEDACRFLELVSRFLKLSQSAKKEHDIEKLQEQALEGVDDDDDEE